MGAVCPSPVANLLAQANMGEGDARSAPGEGMYGLPSPWGEGDAHSVPGEGSCLALSRRGKPLALR